MSKGNPKNIQGQSINSGPWSDVAPAKGLDSAGLLGKTEMKLVVSEQQMPIIDVAVLELEDQIPIIDMAVFELEDRPGNGCKEMSEYMARACETWGFFQLINYGIDASLVEKVKEASRGFFEEPEEEKLKYKTRPGVVEWFYSAVGSNTLTDLVDNLYYLTSPPSRKNLD